MGVYSALTILATLALSLAAPAIAPRLGLIDWPDGTRKRHRRPTPLTLGLAILVPVNLFLGLCGAHGLIDDDCLLIALGSTAFLILGLVDDRTPLNPLLRLAAAGSIVLIFVSLAPQAIITSFAFTFTPAPVSLGVWSVPFSVIVLVGFVYAYNMTDGINGLALGLGLMWSLLLLSSAPESMIPVFAVLVATIGIAFYFNLTGRQFLGDGGAYGLGFLIAAMTNSSYNMAGGALPADAVALWFIVPVADCLRLIAVRVAHGRSPLAADRDHFHHRLARLMSETTAVGCYLLLIGGPGLLAHFFPALIPLWFALTLIAYSGFLMLSHRRGLPGIRQSM